MNPKNETLLNELEKYPIKEYKVVGIIDEKSGKKDYELHGKNVPIIKEDINLKTIAKIKKVDTLIISTNPHVPSDLIRNALDLKMAGIKVYDPQSFYRKLTGKIPVYNIDESWLLTSLNTDPIFPTFYKNLKRVGDITFSLIGLLLTAPIMLIVSLAIKLTSGGPVFFQQVRLGINQKPFTLIKFKTMINDAEAKTGPVWSTKNDPRVTKLGRFLRNLRIDEIPQFLNILKGDMSFCWAKTY